MILGVLFFIISIHTFLAEDDVSNNSIYVVLSISIHTFPAEGDSTRLKASAYFSISIHTFLAEGDMMRDLTAKMDDDFNPHLPCGR